MPLVNHPGYCVLPTRAVRFRLFAPHAQTVRLASNFTQWSLRALSLQPTEAGWWEVETPPLNEGVHFYKYIVDGRWFHDPTHPLLAPDGCGGWNSLLGIGGPSEGSPTALRIVSLNLHTYQEEHAGLKLEQIAFVAAALEVDALALQEVGEHLHDSGQPNAGEVIRQRLEHWTGQRWHHVFRMAHVGFKVYREGVSLLARVPLEEVTEYRLSTDPLARNVLLATLPLGALRVRLGTVHLSWPAAGGADQVKCLLDHLGEEASTGRDALLVCGDFNALSHATQIQRMLQAGFLDVSALSGGEAASFPTATHQHWQSGPAPPRGSRSEFQLVSRIDYQFLHAPSPTPRLTCRACLPLFHGRALANVYQPVVSDHIGLLGIYERLDTSGPA